MQVMPFLLDRRMADFEAVLANLEAIVEPLRGNLKPEDEATFWLLPNRALEELHAKLLNKTAAVQIYMIQHAGKGVGLHTAESPAPT